MGKYLVYCYDRWGSDYDDFEEINRIFNSLDEARSFFDELRADGLWPNLYELKEVR